MKNLLAVLFVVFELTACAAIYSGEPSINGPSSDAWRAQVMWGK